MKPQAFQAGEVRDEHDNIIRQGAYGKKTPFATADNSGILDYIINNFDVVMTLVSIVKGGIKINGVYASLQELQTAHPIGTTGDAYMVGMNLYAWVNNKWTNLGSLQGPQGLQGSKGDDGTGLSIKGKYDSLQALKDAHPTGENGDAYMVGINLYVWIGGMWTDCGNIQGPAGIAATIRIGNVEKGTTASVTNRGNANEAIFDFVLPQGEKGKTGDAGKDGISVTHQWRGSVLRVTSASGTSESDLRGPTGNEGKAATIKVGSVVSGDTASVVNSGNSNAVVFDFTLPRGERGLRGLEGKAATIAVDSVSSGDAMSVTNVGTPNEARLKFVLQRGERGPKGDTGAGLSIKGKYDSMQALKDAHLTGENGDAYMVGVNLYVWTGASWTDCGNIQGPAGKDGVSASHSWSGTTLSVTSASGTSSANLVGPQGERGLQGPQGLKGDTGERGPKGEQGLQGPAGVAGKNGTSVTHSWSGSVLKITSASGTSQADLRGPKGEQGLQGPAGVAGKNGTSVTHSWSGSVLKITSASGTSQADLRGPKGDKGDPGAVINNGDVYTNRANIFTAANTFNGSVLNGYNVTNGGKVEADVAKIMASNNETITVNPINIFGLAQSLTAKCCLVIIEGVGAPVINWQGCKMCIDAPIKSVNKTTIVTFLIDDHNAYLVSVNAEV